MEIQKIDLYTRELTLDITEEKEEIKLTDFEEFDSRLVKRGKNEKTMYLLVPKQLRKNLKKKKTLYKVIRLGDDFIFMKVGKK